MMNHLLNRPAVRSVLFNMSSGANAKFKKSVSTVRRLAEYLGCDVLDPNYRFTKRSIRMLAVIGIGYLLLANSIWEKRHDTLMGLKLFVVVTKGIQLVSKFWNVVTSRQNYPVLMTTLESVLNELQQNPSNEPILLRHMTRLNFWQKIMINFYRVAMVIAIVASFILSVINREFTLIFELYIPLVDYKTFFGYAVTTTCHIMFMKIAATVFPAFDNVFLILSLPIGASVDAMGNEVCELNKLLTEAESSNKKQLDEKLRRIYRIHQMLVDFERMVDDHYSGHNLILLTANMVGMVCSIFLGYIKGYFIAYGILAAMVAQISQYCILGTYVAAKNERMVEIVYTINFYKLSANQQRMVSLMLHRAQNATEMTAGGIVPLNMETYVEVLKGMYSYITLLATMIDQ